MSTLEFRRWTAGCMSSHISLTERGVLSALETVVLPIKATTKRLKATSSAGMLH
jgi:hypothetical protein